MGSEPLWVGFQTQTFPTVPPAISPSVARVAVCQPRLSLRPASLELRGVGDIRKTTPEGGNSRISHGVGGGGSCEPSTHSFHEHPPAVCGSHAGGAVAHERNPDLSGPEKLTAQPGAPEAVTQLQCVKRPRKAQKAPSHPASHCSFPAYSLREFTASEPHPGSINGCLTTFASLVPKIIPGMKLVS